MAGSGSEDVPVRDLVAENFGLLIAYVIPGLAGLWATCLWDAGIRGWVAQSASLTTSIGGFLVLTMAALGVGLSVQALRFAAFEVVLAKVSGLVAKYPYLKPPAYNNAQRVDPQVRATSREITDQHYRYYQCHGGLAIAFPVVFIAWCAKEPAISIGGKLIMALPFLIVEAALVAAAIDALRRTRERTTAVLQAVRKEAA